MRNYKKSLYHLLTVCLLFRLQPEVCSKLRSEAVFFINKKNQSHRLQCRLWNLHKCRRHHVQTIYQTQGSNVTNIGMSSCKVPSNHTIPQIFKITILLFHVTGHVNIVIVTAPVKNIEDKIFYFPFYSYPTYW